MNSGDFVESFIALPQGVLHLEERRQYRGIPRGADMETPAAQLFTHYRWGRQPASVPDTFFTERGRLEGYPSKREDTGIWFGHPDRLKFRLKTNVDPPGGQLPTADQLRAMALRLGIEDHRLVDRTRNLLGYDCLEKNK
jgi:hypothetical protein